MHLNKYEDLEFVRTQMGSKVRVERVISSSCEETQVPQRMPEGTCLRDMSECFEAKEGKGKRRRGQERVYTCEHLHLEARIHRTFLWGL